MPTPLTTVAETTITDVSFVVSYLSLFLSCENFTSYTHFSVNFTSSTRFSVTEN